MTSYNWKTSRSIGSESNRDPNCGFKPALMIHVQSLEISTLEYIQVAPYQVIQTWKSETSVPTTQVDDFLSKTKTDAAVIFAPAQTFR